MIAACVASNCLLIFNHLAMKQTHYRMGEVVEVPPTTPAERERDIKHALWRHNAVFAAEKAALLLFVLESILIAGYVWTLPR